MNESLGQQQTMEIADYIAILGRRKLPFLLVFTLVLVIGVIVAFTLPPVYRSEATILIERQEIPQDLVATTVTGYVQERIEGIKQRLVTYENLVEISKSLNLFSEMREKGDISNMVKMIRENISVEMVDIKAGSSKSVATVAFTVGYEAENPATARIVAAELSRRYLEENKLARSEQAAEVSNFLAQETERLREEIVDLEKTLAKFKQQQASQLPELLQVNMRLYEKTEGQIEATKDRISKIGDQILALETELSLTDPRKAVRTEDGKIIQSPMERLSVLASEYLQASVRYSADHPDMIRMRREIQALGSQSKGGARVSELVTKLIRLKGQLSEAKQKYANEHPDVKRLQKATAAVENELRGINLNDDQASSLLDIPADNPRFIALKTQLDTAKSNLKEEVAKLKNYSQKLSEYEARVFQTPIVERDYQILTRNYGNAKKKYEELTNKQMEARLAEQLEAGEKGERFVLEGAAYLPTSPDRPNRLGIALLSGLLAFMGGIGAVGVAEFKDRSIRGSKGVSEVFGALPIVVIPYIQSETEVSKQGVHRLLRWAILLLALFLLLIATHYLWKPLDTIWPELFADQPPSKGEHSFTN